jgi:predicted transcriptional regulator
MEVELLPHQVAELTEIAPQTGRGTDELVRKAVDQLLSENDWLRREARVGIEQIERGEFIDEDEMAERVDHLLRR